jgi:hypothetical protein
MTLPVPVEETVDYKLKMAKLELEILRAVLDVRRELKATDEELEEALRRIVADL